MKSNKKPKHRNTNVGLANRVWDSVLDSDISSFEKIGYSEAEFKHGVYSNPYAAEAVLQVLHRIKEDELKSKKEQSKKSKVVKYTFLMILLVNAGALIADMVSKDHPITWLISVFSHIWKAMNGG